MIRLIVLALLFFIGYTLVQALLRPGQKGGRPKSHRRDGETMVHDPQCGAYFPVSEAVEATIAGKHHYFCSRKCRKLYKKANK